MRKRKELFAGKGGEGRLSVIGIAASRLTTNRDDKWWQWKKEKILENHQIRQIFMPIQLRPMMFYSSGSAPYEVALLARPRSVVIASIQAIYGWKGATAKSLTATYTNVSMCFIS